MRIRILVFIKRDGNLRPLLYWYRLKGSIWSLHYERPRPSTPQLSFETIKLLNFDFIEDPDSAFHSNADPETAFKIS
jgi:hypothetical protein